MSSDKPDASGTGAVDMPDDTSNIVAESEPSSIRLVATLALAGLISGVAIIGIYEATFDTIAANKARELREAVFKVLPGVERMQKLVYREDKLTVVDDELKGELPIYGGYDSKGKFVGYPHTRLLRRTHFFGAHTSLKFRKYDF